MDTEAMKPSAILTADLHLRSDQPICRTDNYQEAQDTAVSFIKNLQQEHGCPILVPGDIFDKAKSSPYLEQWIIRKLTGCGEIIVIPGQHDLPNHNIELYEKSSLAVLEAAGILKVGKENERLVGRFNFAAYPYPYGSELKQLSPRIQRSGGANIAMFHRLIYPKMPHFEIGADVAMDFLIKMKGFDLIVVGDNHQSFSVKYKDRILVNPGSMMRMKADQIKHKPRVALWYAENNSIEWVELPIKKDVISRVHIERKEKRDERIQVFVSRLNDDYEVGSSFEKNLEEFYKNNKVKKTVKQIIQGAIENE